MLVLDEPVARFAPLARCEFMKALVDAVADGELTVLLSSHVVADLERVCDHLVLLRDGRVRLAGDIDDLLDSHRMLVGPRCDDTDQVDGTTVATDGRWHSNLLVRQPTDAQTHPRGRHTGQPRRARPGLPRTPGHQPAPRNEPDD